MLELTHEGCHVSYVQLIWSRLSWMITLPLLLPFSWPISLCCRGSSFKA